MRAFIGLALPSTHRDVLEALQRELAQSQADVKWVEPDNLHFTLKFLDDITDAQRQSIEAMLARLARQHEPFLIGLDGVGAFPSIHAPRVLWVGVSEGKEPLTRLANAIETEARALGLRQEERPFASHLTLGRVRSSQQRSMLTRRLQTTRWDPPPPWRVTNLTFYQSVLSSQGPHYTVLLEAPFPTGTPNAAR